jgi:probable O-glycosylation ligase (exosortase A-associated)
MYLSTALTLFILGMLPVCFSRPWIGVLMWCWLSYMNPHRLTWSYAYSMPFAMIVAVTTLSGFLASSDRKPLPWTRETYLLAAIWLHFVLTTLLSMNQAYAWDYLLKVSKILLFTFLPLMVMQDRKRVRLMLMVIAMSIGFFGLKGGIWAIVTGGGNRVMMPDDTMLGGANGAGLALNIAIPMLLYLSYDEPNFWLRRLLKITFIFSIPASLFTYSRGAVLGLIAIVLMLAAKSRYFVRAVLGLVVLYVFMVNFAPPQWTSRMETIQTYETDNSAMSRIEAWKIAYGLGMEHPFFGGGFGSVGMDEVAARYNPGKGGYNSHSIFFNVLGEHGLLGLILFLSLIGSCMLTLRRIRKARPSPPPGWLVNASHALETSFVGYLVTGAFLSAAYIDLFYHLITLTILLKVLADRAMAEAPKPPPRDATARVAASIAARRTQLDVRNRGAR